MGHSMLKDREKKKQSIKLADMVKFSVWRFLSTPDRYSRGALVCTLCVQSVRVLVNDVILLEKYT